MIGQSLGGLLATEILINHTALFNNYYIISPSLWWDNESLLNKSFKTLPSDKTIFLAVGKEGKMMITPAKKLASKIKKSGAANCTFLFKYYPDKNHGDMLHQAIYDAFRLMEE